MIKLMLYKYNWGGKVVISLLYGFCNWVELKMTDNYPPLTFYHNYRVSVSNVTLPMQLLNHLSICNQYHYKYSFLITSGKFVSYNPL